MKRNSESRYRQKIISKYYMNKSEQIQLDNIVNHPTKSFMKTTYKELYMKPRNESLLFMVSNVNQCRILLQKCNINIKTKNGYKPMYDVLRELSNQFNKAIYRKENKYDLS
jgi:hypothetical protein